jgi:hypothetical protein
MRTKGEGVFCRLVSMGVAGVGKLHRCWVERIGPQRRRPPPAGRRRVGLQGHLERGSDTRRFRRLSSSFSPLLSSGLAQRMLVPPFLLTLLSYFSASMTAVPPQADRRDHASFASPSLVQSEHLHLDWTVNWAEQTISGSVRHLMVVKEAGLDQVVLDCRDLAVSKVVVGETEVKVRAALALRVSNDARP